MNVKANAQDLIQTSAGVRESQAQTAKRKEILLQAGRKVLPTTENPIQKEKGETNK